VAEPRWLNRLMVDTIHSELLLEHGGAPGIRDGGEDLLADLAAAYLFGLAKNHGYVDCNTAFAGQGMFTLVHTPTGCTLLATVVRAEVTGSERLVGAVARARTTAAAGQSARLFVLATAF